MTDNLKACFLSYPGIYRFVHRFIYIKNTTALLAPEVIVVLSITIEPAHVTGKAQFGYLSILC